MSDRAKIENLIRASGLWDGIRESTHRFLLTPETFSLEPDKVDWLRKLGSAITECLSGLGRIASIAANPDLAKNHAWQLIRRITQFEVPTLFRDLQLLRPSSPPIIFRIDVVESVDKQLFVVEIEATKSHGLGYASLFAKVAKTLKSTNCLPGIVSLLANEMRRRDHDSKGITLVLLYSESEHFYLPEFEILQQELQKNDIRLVIANEHEVEVANESLLIRDDIIANPLLLGLPIFNGSRERAPNKKTEKAIATLYENKVVDCLIPPKPFLGSKSMMAILRNDAKNEEVEAILRSQINGDALRTVRDALPETFLVEPNLTLPEISETEGYVLKEVVSSGAHGICFSGHPNFESTLKIAKKANGRFVLQRIIEARTRNFRYYPHGESVEKTQSWHTRIGVFYIARELADVCVTGCRLPPVHGGRDAIFMGTAIS